MKQDKELSRYRRDRNWEKLQAKNRKAASFARSAQEPRRIMAPSASGNGQAQSLLQSFANVKDASLAEAKKRREAIERARAFSQQDRELMTRLARALEANTAVMRQVHGIEEPVEEASEPTETEAQAEEASNVADVETASSGIAVAQNEAH